MQWEDDDDGKKQLLGLFSSFSFLFFSFQEGSINVRGKNMLLLVFGQLFGKEKEGK